MEKFDYSLFMDITDLKSSARFLTLCAYLLELQANVEALSSLVALKYDTHAIEAAKAAVKNQDWYVGAKKELCERQEALFKAQNDPQARLQAMFKAKMEGRI